MHLAWVAAYRERLDAAPPAAEKPLAEADWPAALGAAIASPMVGPLRDRDGRSPRLRRGRGVGAAPRPRHRGRGDAWPDQDRPRSARAWARPTRHPDVWRWPPGSAYWASRYQELPGPPLLIGHQNVHQALADLPYLPEETPREFLISALVAHVADIADEFEQAVASLGPGGDAVALLDAMAVEGARAYLRNAESDNTIALIHTVTAPLALELVLPWLAPEDHDAALAYTWQAVASIHVAYDIDRHAPDAEQGAAPGADALVASALESGDAHALKLTEAALRCHARTHEAVLLQAAAATASLRRSV